MYANELPFYRCPQTGESLRFEAGTTVHNDQIIAGVIAAPGGRIVFGDEGVAP